MRVIYASAYYRGLNVLLDMWPQIRKECPDATLDIFYGWGSWDALEGINGLELKRQITSKLHELKKQGVTEHGRVSHEQLAKEFKKADVWAYPSEFPEIHCITALKALKGGCYPVTTGVGAVKETQGGFGDIIDSKNIYTNEYAQKKFIKATIKALKNAKDYDPTEQIKFADNFSWSKVAAQWEELI